MPDAAFKTLFKELVERTGGTDAAAACVRVHRSSISNYGNKQHPSFAPLDVVAKIEAVAGEHLITDELARRAGCVLVPVEPIREGELAMLLAHVGQRSGDVFAAFATAMMDGHACGREQAEIRRELSQLLRAVHAAMSHLDAGPTEVQAGPVPLAQAGGSR